MSATDLLDSGPAIEFGRLAEHSGGSHTIALQQYAPRCVEMSEAEARALAQAAGTKIRVAPAQGARQWILTAGNYVGTLVVGGRSIIIKPKIPPENLFTLLEVGLRDTAWRPEHFAYGQADNLLPAVVTWFARLVETTFARGLLRNYRQFEEPLVAMRGRLDVAALFRQPGLTPPVPCQFEEFTSDIRENRYLRCAIHKARRVPGVAIADRQRLLRELARMEEVADVVATSDAYDRITFNRLNKYYAPALRIARLILENVTLTDHEGGIKTATFLVDMNKLFEDFVTQRLQTLLRGRLEVETQTPVDLDVGRKVRMRPDLVFGRRGRPVYLADTKYKIAHGGEAKNPDYYQLLAYTTALDLDEGVLIYCFDDSADPQRRIRNGTVTVRHTHKRLVTYCVDLSGSPSEIDTEMERLADWIAARATTNAPPLVQSPTRRAEI